MKKILCLLLAFLLAGCAAAPAETEPVEVSGTLTAHYLRGGVLLQCSGSALLVDCGMEAEALEEYGVVALDAIVLTGCEEQQTKNLTQILEKYPAEVYAPGAVEGVETTLLTEGLSFRIDCARLTVLGSGEAVRVDFGENSLLFAGELTEEAQAALVQKCGKSLPADILWLRDSVVLTRELADAVKPGHAIVGGRKTEDLTALLKQTGAAVLDTADSAPITLETDGSRYSVSWGMLVTDSVASGTAS